MLENSGNELYDMAEENKIRKLVERIYDDYTDDSRHGIAKYTMRYGRKNEIKLRESILNDKKNLDSYVGKELYKKIYPVFWLEMLNRNHTGKTNNKECLVEPIQMEIEKEQYLFAMLLDKRTEDISNNTIFSGIQRLYTARYKRVKRVVNKYNMKDESNRLFFVRWMKKCLYEEKTSGNLDKQIFENNIMTVREMMEIGGKERLDIPAFIFLLDRLTGWIEFYNYVLIGEAEGQRFYVPNISDGDEKETREILENNKKVLDDLLVLLKKCTEKDELIEVACKVAKCVENIDDLESESIRDDRLQPEYAAFEDLIDYNHIAFLYAWGKYVRGNEYLGKAYYSILGKEFMRYIAEAYDEVINNRKYVQEDSNLAPKSIWYISLYDELFVNDISKVNKATRIDGLNFYDTYITWKNFNLL